MIFLLYLCHKLIVYMGNLKKKLDSSVKKTTANSQPKRERVVFKDISDAERQRLRIGVYPYLM